MCKTTTVLLIEDSPSDSGLIVELARSIDLIAVSLEACATLKEGLQLADKRRYDAVLLDLNLPDARGTDGLQRIRQEHPQMPVIILTGNTEIQDAVLALEQGAQDYIPKNELSANILGRAIRYAIERQKQIMEIKTLRGMIRICSVCHKIVNEEGTWSRMERYIKDHSEADFSHGYCPECADNALADLKRGISA